MMKKIIYLILGITLLAACESNRTPKPFTGERQFHTTDPARLYFKNVRSFSYYRTRKPHSEIDIYQVKKFSRTDKRPILYPQIIDNWLDNEAYIFIEKNAFPKYASPLTVQAVKDTASTTFTIDVFNKKNQYEFVGNIYQALSTGAQLSVKTKEASFVPLFQNYQDKSNFLTTIQDYYRLIELDRKAKLSR